MIITISTDNHVGVLDSLEEAERQPELEHFSSPEELAELVANWPASRLVEIWNNLPGVTPVKKFTDRATGVTRIWKAIQELGAPAAAWAQDTAREQGIEATSEEPGVAETASPVEDAHVAPRASDVAPADPESTDTTTSTETAPVGARKAPASREGSKGAIILGLLKREGGATLEELMQATGWQKHSVRGFLAGTVNKKMGLALMSVKGDDGVRRYSIPA